MEANNKAMREALDAALVLLEERQKLALCRNGFVQIKTKYCDLKDAIEKCRVALACPPRNCDRFNTGDQLKDAEDAYGAWQRYCDDPTIPPSCKVESAFRQWIFATAKPETEGEGDGRK